MFLRPPPLELQLASDLHRKATEVATGSLEPMHVAAAVGDHTGLRNGVPGFDLPPEWRHLPPEDVRDGRELRHEGWLVGGERVADGDDLLLVDEELLVGTELLIGIEAFLQILRVVKPPDPKGEAQGNEQSFQAFSFRVRPEMRRLERLYEILRLLSTPTKTKTHHLW